MAVINGDSGNNNLVGTADADTISGFSGNDTLNGNAGNDSLDGGSGDDRLFGREGDDTIDGGDGDDRVFYFREGGSRGILADLNTNRVTDTHGDVDTLISIEFLFGSLNNDQIYGSDGRDTLFGNTGNDSIYGRGDDDILTGDAGSDVLDGGAGSDQVAYFFETGSQGVSVNLVAGTATDTFGDTDTLFGIERILGSNHNDTLRGSADANFFYGRAGDDLLESYSGVDTLVGDEGNDTINGGGGFDVLSYFFETGSGGISIDLGTNTATDTHGDTDTITGIQTVQGTNQDDRMIGSDREPDERFIGYDGDDYMDGRDGKDYYSTGSGNDTIIVGATLEGARDTIVVSGGGNKTVIGGNSEGTLYGHHIIFAIDEAITINLKDGIATSANHSTDFTQALFMLEVNGTMHDDHIIGGNPLFDYLEWYTGNQGDDTIDGGTGTADTVIYEPEELIGSFNFDLGRTEFGSFGVIVDLANGTARDSFGDTDTLINIDHVRGTAFSDRIVGSDEDNAFWALQGNDTLDGGDGFDIVHYGEDYIRGGNAGVTVNLSTGVAIDGHGDQDELISIESIHATDQNDFVTGNNDVNRLFGYSGNDQLVGAGGGDVLVGGAGNDTLQGGAGDDELVGDAGNDALNGGDGTDIVRYLNDTGGVSVNLSTQRATDSFGGADTLTSIEGAHGSDHNDTLLGSGGDNELSGFDGNDSLTGLTGADTMLGGSGNDTLIGGSQNDELWGGDGNDVIDGGDGTDLARYRADSAGVNVDLAAGTASDGAGGNDTLTSIEGAHGSEHGDTLRGDAAGNELSGFGGTDVIDGRGGDDTLLGGGGADILTGGNGNDELWGEGGADRLDGGDGFDIVRYRSSTSGVFVELDQSRASDGLGGNDVLVGIEGAHGSDQADTLRGNGSANELSGFGGNDTLQGQGGADTLIGGDGDDDLAGGDGDDQLLGGDGFDRLDGGAGNDLVRYRDDVAGVSVNLANSLATDGAGNTDTLLNIEYVDGSDHGDRLTGNSGNNRIFGYTGNDTIAGGGGSDTLRGGTGNDSMTGGDGNDELWGEQGHDTIEGGAGTDLIRYLGATGGVTVDLSAGSALDGFGAQDRLVSIENVHGSTHSDVIRGGTGANELRGFEGNDALSGFGGNDTLLGDEGNDTLLGGTGNDNLRGGAGNDALDGGSGTDIARYVDSTNGVVVDLAAGAAQDGFGGSDALTGIEGAHGSENADTLRGNTGANELSGFGGADRIEGALGADTLLGGDGNDTLLGGGGNDILSGGAGADSLDGGANVDIARYLDESSAVNINLFSNFAIGGGGARDTLTGIEGAHGSEFADTLTGDTAANELSGFGGADTISGSGGNDTILGGAGNDSLLGGSGNDELWGEAGNDVIDGEAGTDLIRYRNAGGGTSVNLAGGTATDGDGGNDVLRNIENAHGSDHGDSLRGSNIANELSGFDGADTIVGEDGNDTLLGGAGDDNISGGAGNDEIWGEEGDDTIDGGAGDNDLLRYRGDATGVSVNLSAGTATDGAGGTDQISNIEDVHTSDHADFVRGNAGTNRLFGFGGNDTMQGDGGNDIILGDGGADSILGGSGNDEIWGGAGADTLDGGDGTDLVRYRDAIGTVNVNLATGTAGDGFGSTDTLSDVESVDGSDFGDMLTGNGSANQLRGYVGRDTISGGGGNDTLLGGADADSIVGGDGNDQLWGESSDAASGAGSNDTIDGGDGTDLVRFRQASSGLNVNLILGTATGEGSDVLLNIENIDGSDHDDMIVGNNSANILSGFGGSDTLIGGADADTLVGRQGGDRYEFNAGDGRDVVNDLGDGSGTDRIVFHDYFARNASIVQQSPGSATIVIDFGNTRDSVRIANTLNAGHDSAIEEIEWADGTVWNHATLISNLGQQGTIDSAGPTPLDNLINRTPEDDVMDALGGNDLVRGLGGDDSLSGSEGNDTLIGGEGNDTLRGGDGNDVLEGGPGNDVKDGGAGSDTAIYGVALSDAEVTLAGGTFTITSHLGTDTVTNIESFRFTDQTLTLAQMTAIGQNAAPTTTMPGTLLSTEGAISVDLSGHFNDPESAALSFEVQGLPPGLTVSQSGLVISGTAEGSLSPFSVMITATDPLNGRVTATFDWTINNVNAAPTGGVTISGDALEGQTLSAVTSTLADVDGLGELSYVWLRDGAAIPGADTLTHQLTAADIGAAISVRVSYTDGFGTAETVSSPATAAVENVNVAPRGGVSITGTPTEGQTLTAVTGSLSDGDGLGALALQWMRDGSAIEGATARTYVLGDDDIGARITLQVSYTDAQGTDEQVVSPATSAIANVNDTPTGNITIDGTAAEGQTLSAVSATLDDGDGLGPLSYQWLSNGSAISGATNATFTLRSDDIGAAISVRVGYTDGQGTAETLTSAATDAVSNTNDAPTGGVSITGTVSLSQTLTADTSTLADADGVGQLSYQWMRDGGAISGANGQTYRVVADDIDARLTVQVSYTDGGGAAESVISDETNPVVSGNEAPTGSVGLNGTAAQHQTLVADTSTLADANGLGPLNYQWLRDGADISGATAAAYTMVTADIGTQISVRISYTDGIGTIERVTSTPSATVVNANDLPQGTVQITGDREQGATLTADTSGLTDEDGLGTFLYQWSRDGSEIAGETASTYVATQADVATSLTVQVSYTDQDGTDESVTSVNAGPIANVNDLPTGAPVISGTPLPGEVLTVDASAIADADGIASQIFFEWFKDGTFISGQRAATYTIAAGDINSNITVRAYYTDSFSQQEEVFSDATTITDRVNSAPTGSVGVSGNFNPGQVLTADASGIADADGIATQIFYEWYRGNDFITGQRGQSYTTSDADLGANIRVKAYYTDGFGTTEQVFSTGQTVERPANNAPTGSVEIDGALQPGQVLTADASGLADADGIASQIFYEWYNNGVFISGQRNQTYTIAGDDLGDNLSVKAIFTDGQGNREEVLSVAATVTSGVTTRTGTAGNDRLEGTSGQDSLSGLGGNDTLIGQAGNDTLSGGDGTDVLNAGAGDDIIFGGASEADLRDVVYGGDGNDRIDGGYGNDELRGDAGNDTILGGVGVDNVLGGDGNDELTGQTWSDAIFGGNGDDFINGGFGHDRVNGGAGADRFFHIGNLGHGSDWIQDYSAAQGDRLYYGAAASANDFQVNFTETANAGEAGVREAFVIHRPTGQILWALVDGEAQSEINLLLAGNTTDLLA